MAKNNKSAAQKAAEEEAAQQAAQNANNPEKENISFAQAIAMSKDKSLSSGEKVILANLIQEGWIKDPKYASIVDGASILRDALMGDVIVTQIINGVDTFAMIVRKDEQRYLAIKSMLASQGISLPEFKALPAPTQEQLDQAGVRLLPGETAVVTVKAEDVSEEAKKQKKAEKKIVDSAKTLDNPAMIENEEQLKASLTALMVKPIINGSDKPDARIQRTILFYKGYLTIQANKAENKEEALKQVKEKSLATLLNEITQIIGTCPFSLKGVAGFLRKSAAETGLPISSFCLYRRTADKAKDGNIDEQYLADIVRTLITWSCNSHIAVAKKAIKDLEKLNKANEEANKSADKATQKVNNAAIKKNKEEIAKNESVIEEMNKVIDSVVNPSFEAVDNLIEDYKSENEESVNYQIAHRIVSDIMKTYYPNMKDKTLDEAVMLNNVQQRAGVVVNMFRDPLAQSISYSVANLVDMVIVDKPADPEGKAPEAESAEEEAKN